MPDVKYSDSFIAEKFSHASDYWEIVKEILIEMQRQTGVLKTDSEGVAMKGLLIRHLVLPSGCSGWRKILDFIVRNLPVDTYINIMEQYRPCFKAEEFKEISRRITFQEYKEVVEYALSLGLKRVVYSSTLL